MDDEDFDFDFDTPPKKPPVRKGRRSDSLFSSSPPTSNPASPSSGSFSPSNTAGVPNPPPRSRKTGGWADDGSASTKRNWLRRTSKPSIAVDTPKKEIGHDMFDSDTDIPVIPDLDDVLDEDFAAQIAEAPSVTVNRVATYQELDSDLLKHTAFASLDGIDLRLLTKRLAPEQEIKEDDAPWTWDVLFTDVASQLNAEMENKKDKDTEIFT